MRENMRDGDLLVFKGKNWSLAGDSKWQPHPWNYLANGHEEFVGKKMLKGEQHLVFILCNGDFGAQPEAAPEGSTPRFHELSPSHGLGDLFVGSLPESVWGTGHEWAKQLSVPEKTRPGVSLHAFSCQKCGCIQSIVENPTGFAVPLESPEACTGESPER